MVRVLSLGGSVIVPDKIDYNYLMKFRSFIVDYAKKEKIVIVCGGGHTARVYIKPLERAKISRRIRGYIGIRVTRLNAWLLIDLFQGKCASTVAKSLEHVKELLKKNRVVIAGGLSYVAESSSDASAVQIAHMLKSDFINITNVKGIYNKNPKLKRAKFIPYMSFSQLYEKLKKIGFRPGQHGVLDLHASELIKKYKIKTYVIGKNLDNLKKLLEKSKFIGTVISDKD